MLFTISGKVLNGNKIGRKLGYPTANLKIDQTIALTDGVYVAQVLYENHLHDGVASVGQKPSIGGGAGRNLEVHIFDFSGDLYGRQIEVTLTEFIRPEKRFATMEELKKQIEEDCAQARNIIKNRR